jgi:ABC-type phosphate transport system substrate-binding protein
MACAAIVGSFSFAPSAEAATTCFGDTNCSLGASPYTFGANDVYGGGSSLLAPYARQFADCYGKPADLVAQTSSPPTTPPSFVDETLFNYPGEGTKGTGAQNCVSQNINNTTTTWYISAGSGNGIASLFGHDPVTFFGEVNANGPQFFAEQMYANSDAGLGSTDVGCYDNGSCTEKGAVIGAPGTPCNTVGSPYPVPAQCYGPLIQYPVSIDPVAIFYPSGGIYEKVSGSGVKEIDYTFKVSHSSKDGGLRLSQNTLCGIWNRVITNWNDPAITADNGGVSLESPKDPTPATQWSVPLTPVGRSDSSGTTSIITRHLANICANYNGNQYANGATTLPAGLQGNTYNPANPNYPGVDLPNEITLAPNSSGVTQYVAFTQIPQNEKNQCPSGTVLPTGYSDCIQQARVGYVGADYVMPYVKGSHTNSYNLFQSTLLNHAGNWEPASPKGAVAAFKGIQPPQSNAKGGYCTQAPPTCSGGARNDPTQWAESTDKGQPLADPTATTAYPLVGTTNELLYTCYANPTSEANLSGQLSYVETADINTDPTNGILAAAGLSPLPKQWLTAIDQSFITGKDGLGLNVQTVSNGNTGPCQAGQGIVGG